MVCCRLMGGMVYRYSLGVFILLKGVFMSIIVIGVVGFIGSNLL